MRARGREGPVRRSRRRSLATLLVCLGLAAGWAPGALANVPAPVVSVEDQHSVSDVQGRFEVPVPLSVAWDVLTDYDHIADFVSSMRASAVESRSDSGLTVRQEAAVGPFPFRRVAHLLLDVRELPDRRIEFHDLLDRDFRLYRGAWELSPEPSGTAVTYVLHAQPTGAIPSFISHAFLSRTVRRLLTQVQAEMIRRASAGEAP
jgi:carbon monoxide dehydrogenase subunit G